MKNRFLACLSLLAFTLAACQKGPREDHHGDDANPHAHEEKSGHLVTRWSSRTELFLEYPHLSPGEPAEFLAHLTGLRDFKPLEQAVVEVIVVTPEGKRTFSVSKPSRPGIFKPTVTLEKPGHYQSTLVIQAPGWKDRHELGEIEVHGSEKAEEQKEAASEGIPFLKEQQWQADFATDWVKQGSLPLTVSVPGTIRASTHDARVIKAPAAGSVEGPLPTLGASIEAGQTLARIATAAGTRSIEADRLGVVAVVHVSAGDPVEAGQTIVTLLDLSKVWVEARVYEADLPRVSRAKKAVVELPGAARHEATLVSAGGTLDSATRTLPFVFEMPNSKGLARIGMTCQVDILTGETAAGVVVPASAIIDDAGQPTAYVQPEGETFERRALKLGLRQGDRVQVLEGLKPGERVVTRGGFNIRLAGSTSAMPSHLH
ncbi:MAG: efflux RND transporter periplasmic adaptor subunit [Elusimicrobia bacterium]|nr:efflux RND transporter periplasmic adaptor subunit [Elusimicrobiota bacterium]